MEMEGVEPSSILPWYKLSTCLVCFQSFLISLSKQRDKWEQTVVVFNHSEWRYCYYIKHRLLNYKDIREETTPLNLSRVKPLEQSFRRLRLYFVSHFSVVSEIHHMLAYTTSGCRYHFIPMSIIIHHVKHIASKINKVFLH